jgi:hypothetical protein
MKWHEELDIIKYSPEVLQGLELNEKTREFLTTNGLPESSAPFLSFNKNNNIQYEGLYPLTDRFDFLEPKFSKYISIGSDGNGNEIVIDTSEKYKIKILDDEFNFEEEFMNSSINHLGYCLNAITEFVAEAQKKYGPDGYLDSLYKLENVNTLKNTLESIDLEAMSEGNYWQTEISILFEETKNN